MEVIIIITYQSPFVFQSAITTVIKKMRESVALPSEMPALALVTTLFNAAMRPIVYELRIRSHPSFRIRITILRE